MSSIETGGPSLKDMGFTPDIKDKATDIKKAERPTDGQIELTMASLLDIRNDYDYETMGRAIDAAARGEITEQHKKEFPGWTKEDFVKLQNKLSEEGPALRKKREERWDREVDDRFKKGKL